MRYGRRMGHGIDIVPQSASQCPPCQSGREADWISAVHPLPPDAPYKASDSAPFSGANKPSGLPYLQRRPRILCGS
jgi:hypothetical protein